MFPGGRGGGGGGAGASHYFLQSQQQMFHAAPDADGISIDEAFTGDGGQAAPGTHAHSNALLYNLSVLKDKMQQLQPLVGLAVGHDGRGHVVDPHPLVPGASAIIQEIIAAASSMMYAFQHLSGASLTSVNNAPLGQAQEVHAKNGATAGFDTGAAGCSGQHAMVDHAMHQQWHPRHRDDGNYYDIHGKSTTEAAVLSSTQAATTTVLDTIIIELDAAELLAKYTHYCQVCGKGFKRDANLRMHMRAHGDEYKSKAALASPHSNKLTSGSGEDAAVAAEAAGRRNKYSCPQEGCRWNRKHAKFQPLKSVICVKNHYKRSHCPKMYVCNRCNRKHFSVLSDLRTHEKHCGDHRWLCSCGTTFSRKDKLAGHVSLFAGHEPVVVTMAGRHGLAVISDWYPRGSQGSGGEEEKILGWAENLFDKGCNAMERRDFTYAIHCFSCALEIRSMILFTSS